MNSNHCTKLLRSSCFEFEISAQAVRKELPLFVVIVRKLWFNTLYKFILKNISVINVKVNNNRKKIKFQANLLKNSELNGKRIVSSKACRTKNDNIFLK